MFNCGHQNHVSSSAVVLALPRALPWPTWQPLVPEITTLQPLHPHSSLSPLQWWVHLWASSVSSGLPSRADQEKDSQMQSAWPFMLWPGGVQSGCWSQRISPLFKHSLCTQPLLIPVSLSLNSLYWAIIIKLLYRAVVFSLKSIILSSLRSKHQPKHWSTSHRHL